MIAVSSCAFAIHCSTFAGVVFVDGIPIEATILDAGESGLKGEEQSDPASLALLDPRAVSVPL